ncbi:MAG: FAD binding domain-containing protein, partial [Xanthobacteraceae bacterium]
PMMAVLLDATLCIVSAAGSRAVAARDFFLDAMTVDLDDTELLTEVVLPKLPAHTGWGFQEIVRRHGDFALAAVAATLTLSGSEIVQARIALTGVGPTPLRAAEAESRLVGRGVDERLCRCAIEAVREAISPETDLHASADLRRHLAGVLTGRALAAAWRRGRAG